MALSHSQGLSYFNAYFLILIACSFPCSLYGWYYLPSPSTVTSSTRPINPHASVSPSLLSRLQGLGLLCTWISSKTSNLHPFPVNTWRLVSSYDYRLKDFLWHTPRLCRPNKTIVTLCLPLPTQNNLLRCTNLCIWIRFTTWTKPSYSSSPFNKTNCRAYSSLLSFWGQDPWWLIDMCVSGIKELTLIPLGLSRKGAEQERDAFSPSSRDFWGTNSPGFHKVSLKLVLWPVQKSLEQYFLNFEGQKMILAGRFCFNRSVEQSEAKTSGKALAAGWTIICKSKEL